MPKFKKNETADTKTAKNEKVRTKLSAANKQVRNGVALIALGTVMTVGMTAHIRNEAKKNQNQD